MDVNISSKSVEGVVSSVDVIEGGIIPRYAIDGASAYEIAVKHGYNGTEAEWVNSHFGRNGLTPRIVDGVWWIGTENTGVKAIGYDGKDGIIPHIKDNNWWIGDHDTGVRAEGYDGKDGKDGTDGKDGKDGIDGVDGKNGSNGKDGLTPYIKDDYWWIGDTNTEVRARGLDGDGRTPYIKDGHWWIGSKDTGVRAKAIDNIPEISGTVSTTIGGIKRGTVYTDASIADILSAMLFPHVAPSDVYFRLYDADGDEILGRYEYGKKVTATMAVIEFAKGSKDITSVKIETPQGLRYFAQTTDKESNGYVESITSDDLVMLSTTIQFDGTNDKTVTLSLSDGESTVEESLTVSFKYHNYVAVTTDTTIPTSATASGEVISVESIDTLSSATIETQDNTYIWFLVPNANKTTIKQYALTSWNDMSTTYEGTVTFTTSTGKKVTYHAYRSDKLMSNSADYCIE